MPGSFFNRTRGQWLGLWLGVGVLGALLLARPGGGWRPAAAAGVAALMAVWWISEALPIAWTACVPLLLFPLLGVLPGSLPERALGAARPYLDPYIFLFLGGMTIAAAMQQWGLHRRIALWIMRGIGTEARRLLLGVLVATAAVSLWISNTATAAMLVPIALAIVKQLEARGGVVLRGFGAAVMLAVAYGANVGGIGTKIGTAPNMQLSGFFARSTGREIGFFDFALVGVGFVLLFLPLVWLVLWRVARGDAPHGDAGGEVLAAEQARLGPMQRGEWGVLAVFVATAALWIAGKPLTDLLAPRVSAFALRSAHVEGGTAMLAALGLLLLRAQGQPLLHPRSLRLIPWSTLLLLGGGFAMAAGVEQSGLSRWLAERLAGMQGLGLFGQTLIASTVSVALSAFASNTATIAVMLPVLLTAVPAGHASTVLFAATIGCSCDFALPAGTPPNAIVFGTGYVTVPRMARTGVLLDAAAAGLCACWCWLVVGRVL